ncbi:MAG: sulfatase-like hydrolase/transferase [Verrucomicrobiales bacterium]|nr:sulfatase-like hydrolase/transferase [Verrucomicrobiales bacterium]
MRLFLVVIIPVFLVSLASQGKEEARPNVILIMTDDQGYADLSSYGHDKIKTPRLDALAKGGLRLTSFYTGAAVCTPSRMALLTGAYPARLGWTRGVDGYLMPKKSGLHPEALTIAEIFHEEGYATGISGKWHLGREPGFRPHRQGFDFTYYIPMSNNQIDSLWVGDGVVEKPFDNRLLTEQFTKKAIEFVGQERGDQPYFLYLPYTAPHFPVEAHPEWKGKSAFGEYGDVIEELDFRIGELIDFVEKQDDDRETLILFLSDNGPQKGDPGRSVPYRGMKWEALDGGQRVPCIICSPNLIPGGRESEEMVASIDLLPTLAEACGIDLSQHSSGSPRIDGLSAWPLFSGESEESARDEILLWHGKGSVRAFRQGRWKLFYEGDSNKPRKAPALFDLASDPGETKDVSGEHPDRVAEMERRWKELEEDIKKNAIPLGLPRG